MKNIMLTTCEWAIAAFVIVGTGSLCYVAICAASAAGKALLAL